jgi:hypothetical protein
MLARLCEDGVQSSCRHTILTKLREVGRAKIHTENRCPDGSIVGSGYLSTFSPIYPFTQSESSDRNIPINKLAFWFLAIA